MNAVVLSCSSLKEYVEDAMKTQNENYDIILIDRSFHTEPARMKEAICKEFKKLPANIDTLLVAMGFYKILPILVLLWIMSREATAF